MPSLNYYHEEYARMEKERKDRDKKRDERRWGVNGNEYYAQERRRGTRGGGLDPELVEKHLEGRRSRHKNRKAKDRPSSKYYFDSSGSEAEHKLYDQLAKERKKLKNQKEDTVDKNKEKTRRKDHSQPRSERHRAKMESSEDLSDDKSQRSHRRQANLRRINKSIDANYRSDEDVLKTDKRTNGDRNRKSRTLPRREKDRTYHYDNEEEVDNIQSSRTRERERRIKEMSKESKEPRKYKIESRIPESTSKTHGKTRSKDDVLKDYQNVNNSNNIAMSSKTLPNNKKSSLFVKPIEMKNKPTETEELFINGGIPNEEELQIAKARALKHRSIASALDKKNKFESRKHVSNGQMMNSNKMDYLTRSVDNINLNNREVNNNFEFAQKYQSIPRKPEKFTAVKPANATTLKTTKPVVKEPEIPRLPSQESTTSNSSNISQKLLSLKETFVSETDEGQLSDASKKSSSTSYMKRISWKRKPKTKSSGAQSETEIEVKKKTTVVAAQQKDQNGVKENSKVEISRKSTASPFLKKDKAVKEVMSEPERRMKQAKKNKSPFIRRKKKDISKITTLQYRPSDLGYPKTKDQMKENKKKIVEAKVAEDNVSVGSRSSNTTSTSTGLSSRFSSQRGGSNDDKRLPSRSSEVVFTVNLDNHTETEPAKTNNKPMFFMGGGGVKTRNISTSSSQNNKWNQTSGPPIRPPPSEAASTQTLINPATCKSIKTQVMPWNLEDLFFHCSTQTEKKYSNAETQTTPEPEHREMSTQCEVKKFADTDAQTANPAMCDSGVSAIATMETMETQTEEEGSKIWGSAVSLDRLIRSRAMKRSRSLTNGVDEDDPKGHSRSRSVGRLSSTGEDIEAEPQEGEQELKSGKIKTYSWSQTNKFVKIFVSYSGVHLIPTSLINVKTNGINLSLSIKEPLSEAAENGEVLIDKSSLKLNRLTRPVAALSYTVQRDMITIMLRKQKALEWRTLLYGQSANMLAAKSENNLLR